MSDHTPLCGLSKRELFAMMAMEGLLSAAIGVTPLNANLIAASAVAVADQLIKELDKW
jgi:hypothetical protein